MFNDKPLSFGYKASIYLMHLGRFNSNPVTIKCTEYYSPEEQLVNGDFTVP